MALPLSSYFGVSLETVSLKAVRQEGLPMLSGYKTYKFCLDAFKLETINNNLRSLIAQPWPADVGVDDADHVPSVLA